MTAGCKTHSLLCFGLDKGYLDLGKFIRQPNTFCGEGIYPRWAAKQTLIANAVV